MGALLLELLLLVMVALANKNSKDHNAGNENVLNVVSNIIEKYNNFI